MLRTKLFVGALVWCAWAAACSSKSGNDFACIPGENDCICRKDGSCADGLACNHQNRCALDTPTHGGEAGGEAGSELGSGGAPTDHAGRGSTMTGGNSARGGRGSHGDNGHGAMSSFPPPGGASGEAGQGGEAGQSGAGAGPVGGEGGAATGGTAAGGHGGAPDTAGQGGAGNAGAPGTGCREVELPATMKLRNLRYAPEIAAYTYELPAGSGGPGGTLLFDFYASSYDSAYDGEHTGNFTLGSGIDANFATCARCMRAVLGAGETTYFAESGSMNIAESSDQMNGFPVITLSDVKLVEVSIDAGSATSTPVPDGRCLHLAGGSLAFPSGWTCDPSYYSAGGADGCDCGCGVRDGDCADGQVNACNFCYCVGDALDCSDTRVSSSDNAVCL